jgi:hypothetical protein
MSFRLSFHQPLLGPTRAHWLDDLSDLSCKESTRQHAVDAPLLSCKQQVGGSSPLPAPADAGQSARLPARRVEPLWRHPLMATRVPQARPPASLVCHRTRRDR